MPLEHYRETVLPDGVTMRWVRARCGPFCREAHRWGLVQLRASWAPIADVDAGEEEIAEDEATGTEAQWAACAFGRRWDEWTGVLLAAAYVRSYAMPDSLWDELRVLGGSQWLCVWPYGDERSFDVLPHLLAITRRYGHDVGGRRGSS